MPQGRKMCINLSMLTISAIHQTIGHTRNWDPNEQGIPVLLPYVRSPGKSREKNLLQFSPLLFEFHDHILSLLFRLFLTDIRSV